MHIEKATKAIEDWYDGESFTISGIIDKKPFGCTGDFDQHEDFISVIGYQNSVGESGDSFEGKVYFEYEANKFIVTEFWV